MKIQLPKKLNKFNDNEWDELIHELEKMDSILCTELKQKLCKDDIYHYGTSSSLGDSRECEYEFSCHNCDKEIKFEVKIKE